MSSVSHRSLSLDHESSDLTDKHRERFSEGGIVVAINEKAPNLDGWIQFHDGGSDRQKVSASDNIRSLF